MSPSVPALTGTMGALVPIGYFLEERKSEFVLVWLKSCFLSMVVFFFFFFWSPFLVLKKKVRVGGTYLKTKNNCFSWQKIH